MRLSRAVSSAMAPPPPLLRGPGGGREGGRRGGGGQRGVPPVRAQSRPRRPSWALSHVPGSGPSADTDEKKAEGKRKCPDLFGSRGSGRGRVPPRARKHRPGPPAGTRRGRGRVARRGRGPGGDPPAGPPGGGGEEGWCGPETRGRTVASSPWGPRAQPIGMLFGVVDLEP